MFFDCSIALSTLFLGLDWKCQCMLVIVLSNVVNRRNSVIVFADVFIHCTGTPGHGSLLHDNTAGEKVAVVIEKFMARRAQEKKKLTDNPKLTIGDVTTINLTTLEVIYFWILQKN